MAQMLNDGFLQQGAGAPNQAVLDLWGADDKLVDGALERALTSEVTCEKTGAVQRAAAKPRKRRSEEDTGPDLRLDDENALFFAEIGCRKLLTEMVLNTLRDIVALRDQARVERLSKLNPEVIEEMRMSAEWLKQPNGMLAIQIMYPDWDHASILANVYEDPEGVLRRFDRGIAAAKESADSAEIKLADSVAARKRDRLDIPEGPDEGAVIAVPAAEVDWGGDADFGGFRP